MFHSDSLQLSGENFSGPANIALVFRQRRNRRNTQKRLQFFQKTELVIVRKFKRGGCLSESHESPSLGGPLNGPAPCHAADQYLGTFGSTSRDHASIPPRSDCTFSNPWLRSQTATFIDRTPEWQMVTMWASGSSFWRFAGISPIGRSKLPSILAV